MRRLMDVLAPGVIVGLLLLHATGCAYRKPDLAELYQDWANQKQGRPPLVGIHGLMGSEIVDPNTGKVLWGKVHGLFSTTADMHLALPLGQGEKTTLVATGSIKKIGGVEVYAGIVQTLTQDGGYTLVKGSDAVPEAPFFPFAYDWRLSCVENARRLSVFIDAIGERCHDPDIKVDIVAHSMGGLIARYYLLYDGKDVLGEAAPVPTGEGAAKIRKLVMLGTPNMGSVSSLLALIDGNRVGLARIPPDLISTMPSVVQLMPSPSEYVLFSAAGHPVPLDIYDVRTWEQLAREADFFGRASGRNTDKLAATGLMAVRSELVDAPYLAGGPLVLECAVRHTLKIGLHTMFVGEILDIKAAAEEDLDAAEDLRVIQQIKMVHVAADPLVFFRNREVQLRFRVFSQCAVDGYQSVAKDIVAQFRCLFGCGRRDCIPLNALGQG